MTDQSTDRERAVKPQPQEAHDSATATAKLWLSGEVVPFTPNMSELCRCYLAIHAENERLRAHTLGQTKRIRSLLQTVYSVRSLAACGEAAIASEIEKRLTEYDRITYGNQTQGPKMTETQVETGPSDDLLPIWNRHHKDRGFTADDARSMLREAFQAGRASLAGELAKRFAEGVASEEARLGETLRFLNAENATLKAELEAEKAAHAETRKQADRFAERLGEHARLARVMPSYEAIYEALRLCPDSGQLMPWQLHRLTNAVLRLLTPTQERPFCREAPPDSEIGQMHELLLSGEDRHLDCPIAYAGMCPPVGSRSSEFPPLPTWDGWRMGGYGSVLGWRRAQPQGEAAKCEHREWTAEDDFEDNPSDVGTGAQCDQLATHVGCKPFTGSKTCEEHKCRCAKPIAARPVEPAADPIEALSKRVERAETDLDELNGLYGADLLDVRKRLDELELQGRVARRICTDNRAMLTEATWVRIEREERAK